MSRLCDTPSPLKKQNRRLKVSNDLLTDMICCWLISVGVLLAVRQLFRFDNPLTILMIRSAVVLVLGVLLTRRFWILPAVLASSFILAIAGMKLTGKLSFFISDFMGFTNWWFNLFPRASAYNRPEMISLVNWILTVWVCAAVSLFVRRMRSFALVYFVSAALFIIIGINGFHENLGGLCFIAAGSLPLLTRSYRRQISKKINETLFSPRKIMIPALVICSLCALTAHQLVPSDTSLWKNKTLSNLIETTKEPSQQPFTLETSGLQPNEDKLGGNINLKHKPELIVETNQPFLMKGMVYEAYTGNGWTASPSRGTYKMGFSSSEAMNDVFNLDLPIMPGDSNQNLSYSKFFLPSKATVTMLSGGKTLFTCGRIRSLAPISESADIFFNARSEIFANKILPKKFNYGFESSLFNRNVTDSSQMVQGIEQQQMNTFDSMDSYYSVIKYPSDIYRIYTALPQNLPSSIAQKAQEITANIYSPYSKLCILEYYLKSNYTYTLQPGDVPDGEDFVEYFLKSGKGYCVYYASAMCVMARTLDIPSRFVIGYGLQKSGDNWMAYADTAHAWVECYIQGVGWIPFDPTGGTEYSSHLSSDSNAKTNTSDQETTQSETKKETTQTQTTVRSSKSESDTTTSSLPTPPEQPRLSEHWVILILIFLLICLLAAAALRIIQQSKAYTLERMRQRYPNNGACADQYYTDMLRQLRILDYHMHTGETIYQFSRRVCDSLANFGPSELQKDGALVDSALTIIMNWRYGEAKPSDCELLQLSQAHEALEHRVKLKMNRISYLLIRFLFAK